MCFFPSFFYGSGFKVFRVDTIRTMYRGQEHHFGVMLEFWKNGNYYNGLGMDYSALSGPIQGRLISTADLLLPPPG